MRDRHRQVQEKWAVAMLANKCEAVLDELVLRIGFAFGLIGIVARQKFLLIVSPQELRVMIVGVALAVIAVEGVKPLGGWRSGGSEMSKSPFADRGGCVAAGLEQLGERGFAFRQRLLA